MVYDCFSAFSRGFLWELFFEDMNYNNEEIRAILALALFRNVLKAWGFTLREAL